jgi:hypothetical protein
MPSFECSRCGSTVRFEGARGACPYCKAAPVGDGLKAALASELEGVIERGGHYAGVIVVAREPEPGVTADGRVLSAACARDATTATALGLVHIIARLRSLADELEAIARQHDDSRAGQTTKEGTETT